MSNAITTKLIGVYEQMSAPLMFLSGMFQSPAANFHESENVEIDVVRSGEDVSVVIKDLSVGYNKNSTDVYTNKAFIPPVHKEAIVLNSADMLKRSAGENPFASADMRGRVISRLFSGMVKIEAKIRRAMELQASQILQTGILTLVDSSNTAVYTLDFKPKATHFPNAAAIWSNPASDKLADLRALGSVIRADGLTNPDQIIMGEGSFEEFIKDAAVQKRFEIRRMDLGTIAPMKMVNGGEYRGTVEIGSYKYDVWTYGGRFTHPATGVSTPYIENDKVIMRASTGRLDATFGAVPNIGRLLGVQSVVNIPELPTRISLPGRSIDLNTNVWMTPDGETLFGGIASRPLLIPTAIDTFGCLDTLL